MSKSWIIPLFFITVIVIAVFSIYYSIQAEKANVAKNCLVIGETPAHDVIENELRRDKLSGEEYLAKYIVKSVPLMYHYECNDGRSFSAKWDMNHYTE